MTQEKTVRKVSVILPAYNEAGNIMLLVDKVARAFDQNGIDGEAILIDDGSTDGTGDVAREAQKRHPFLRICTHRRNLGLTKALSTGFKAATGDIIIFLCADLQSDPEEDIPKLLAGFEDGSDVVVGWRQNRQESKKWGSRVYNWVAEVLFDVHVHDQNWIKAFRRDCAKNLSLRSDWHRFIVAIAVAAGYKVNEVQTNWYPRTYGESKYGYSRILIAFLDMIVLKIQMKFLDSPIRFFGGTGILFLVAGLAISAVLFVLKDVVGVVLADTVRIKYFLVSILLILLGAGSLALGILGEFLVSHIDRIMNTGEKQSETLLSSKSDVYPPEG